METAGEVGHFLNGSAGWFSYRPSNPKAKVAVITKADKLLPVLSRERALKTETFLNSVGVDVVYNVSVVSSSADADGKTTVNLSNGEQWTADVYIPAWGITPNSKYVPADLKDDRGYIKPNGTSLRADAAGPRVSWLAMSATILVGASIVFMAPSPSLSQISSVTCSRQRPLASLMPRLMA